MPASENSSTARKNAIVGCVRDRPERSLMFSTSFPSRRIARITAKVPSVIAT